ncbi:MAG: MFS transporter [Acidobacteriota bacterium]|jgi:MFS transporter, ACS family, hexuronate transporter
MSTENKKPNPNPPASVPTLIPPDVAAAETDRIGRIRWIICALLFAATTINYIDRQVIGILKPTLQSELGWSEIDYGNIVFWFQVAYAMGYLFAGRVMDKIGVRIGYGLAVFFWSLAAMGHALARTVMGFATARFALGLSEGGNFPAAVKSVSEWFPKKERAFATGLFNAGSNVGALVAPLAVPWLTVMFGWEAAFIATGSLGLLWLVAWFFFYDRPEHHKMLGRAELNYIQSDPPDPDVKVAWLELLRYRQTWAFVVGMFLSGPIWWFYLYWIPDFLHRSHGLNLVQLGPPLVVIYLMTDVGSIGGGWLSSWLIKRGWSINAARKTTMLICALLVVPVFSASIVSGLWVATLLIGLAASAHQGFSANLYTLVSDTAPRYLVSSIVGIGGMAAAIGGMFIAELAGYILEWTGSYLPLFIIAASAYLVNILLIHLINPKLEPMQFGEEA